ncbi:hypothetical protein HDF23_004545 [Mucilaginibacter lappiensis]|uniref:Lipoprotein n=1 Tax=Mucilaginibacter lappiensis TaxID=354630 RepID=A0ABR6PPT0_9SPHI|nr:hypothetical protein [Mucilaginibacter lappiensis]MBB6111773.1 hypothetical protein [Mucilaginibacter lappiensis]
MIKKITYVLTCQLIMLACATMGCKGNTPVQIKDSTALNKPQADRAVKTSVPTKSNDEQQFRAFLKKFKASVKNVDKEQLKNMFYFPLQTQPQWTAEDMKATTINPAEGLVSVAEYPKYEGTIFSKDALRLIPQSREDDLSEIDNTTTENYYITLKKATDKGSTLYELQQQYEQKNGKETSYGFVFGRVKGQYKVISYFCPWPLKD